MCLRRLRLFQGLPHHHLVATNGYRHGQLLQCFLRSFPREHLGNCLSDSSNRQHCFHWTDCWLELIAWKETLKLSWRLPFYHHSGVVAVIPNSVILSIDDQERSQLHSALLPGAKVALTKAGQHGSRGHTFLPIQGEKEARYFVVRHPVPHWVVWEPSPDCKRTRYSPF